MAEIKAFYTATITFLVIFGLSAILEIWEIIPERFAGKLLGTSFVLFLVCLFGYLITRGFHSKGKKK